jgi:hypothetical protein
VELHSLQTAEYNGLKGTVDAALNGLCVNVYVVCLRMCICASTRLVYTCIVRLTHAHTQSEGGCQCE